MDISKTELERSKERGYEVVLADAKCLPFKEDSFEKSYSNYVLCCFENKITLAAISEMLRVSFNAQILVDEKCEYKSRNRGRNLTSKLKKTFQLPLQKLRGQNTLSKWIDR